jgi:hypothetical protein
LFKSLIALASATALTGTAVAQQVPIGSKSPLETVVGLKPGQFIWAPQLAPAGPTLVLVNLRTQRAVVFRNGLPIAASTVSTGRPGHDTPTGVFTVLQKEVDHHSKTYDNAPMPFMERLTWKGVALHAGNLPGYPASHGCVRLPLQFAKLLYSVTKLGMTVVIADREPALLVAPTPDLVTSARSEPALPAATIDWHPEKSPAGPVSILVSAADQRTVVLRNGVIIGSAPVTIDGPIVGAWAYALRSVDGAGTHWVRVELSPGAASSATVPASEFGRFHIADEFRSAIRSILQPGATIVVTADSLSSGGTAQPLTVMEAQSNRS